MFGENAFRVKLNAGDWIIQMAHSHDLTVPGKGRYLQTFGDRLFDDERMVSGGLEGTRYTVEYSPTVMVDRRYLAMHQTRRALYLTAISIADALVPETNAQKRRGRPNFSDDII